MSLSQDSFAFESSSYHGDIVPGPWNPQIVVEEFFGVAGEAHLNGAWGGRDLRCDYDLIGYASSTALNAAILRIDAKINQLTGTLTIAGNISHSFPKCSFLGYERGPMFLDGSGINGWCCFGRLHWRQRNQT